MEVRDVLVKQVPKVLLAEHQEVIETLVLDRT
jgi:hypothetical protein